MNVRRNICCLVTAGKHVNNIDVCIVFCVSPHEQQTAIHAAAYKTLYRHRDGIQQITPLFTTKEIGPRSLTPYTVRRYNHRINDTDQQEMRIIVAI
jgi:hypothetical protein